MKSQLNSGASEQKRFSLALTALLLWVAINCLIAPYVHKEKLELTAAAVRDSNYEHTQRGPWGWWLARSFFNRNANLILMGDSQMNAAMFLADTFVTKRMRDCIIDKEPVALESELKRRGLKDVRALNLGTAGAFISDQYLIAKSLFPHNQPDLVILSIDPRAFIDSTLPSVTSTDSFKYFAPYVDLANMHKYVFDQTLDEWDWWLKQHVPLEELYTSAHELMAHIFRHAEQPVQTDGDILRAVTAASGDFERGDSIMPACFQLSFRDDTSEYRHRYHEILPRQWACQQAFFQALLSYLKSTGTRVLVVGMPLEPSNRALLPLDFWTLYRTSISADCRNHGADWIDLTSDPRFTRSMYMDAAHLNYDGGNLVCRILGEYLASKPDLLSRVQPGSGAH